MENLIHADIFFFITSIAVVVVTLVLLICLFYILRTVKKFDRLMETLERELKGTNAQVQEIVEDIRASKVYTFLFHRKRKAKSAHHDHEAKT